MHFEENNWIGKNLNFENIQRYFLDIDIERYVHQIHCMSLLVSE